MIFTRYLMGTAYLPKPSMKQLTYSSHTPFPPKPNVYSTRNPQEDRRRLRNRGGKLETVESLEELGKMRARIVGLATKYG